MPASVLKFIAAANIGRALSWNDSQSSPASLKQLSSKSNNEYREKAGPDQSKTMWANAVFFCHVLRILLSELDKDQDKPSLGTKE